MPGMGARIRVNRGQSTANDGSMPSGDEDPLANIPGVRRVNIVNGMPRMGPSQPPPPRGLTDEQIKNLPKFKYTAEMGPNMFDCCTICYYQYAEMETIKK